jgi:hypothetical protein
MVADQNISRYHGGCDLPNADLWPHCFQGKCKTVRWTRPCCRTRRDKLARLATAIVDGLRIRSKHQRSKNSLPFGRKNTRPALLGSETLGWTYRFCRLLWDIDSATATCIRYRAESFGERQRVLGYVIILGRSTSAVHDDKSIRKTEISF